MSIWRGIAVLVGLVAGPMTAGAVPVTWEAQGVVESSSLGPGFFAAFMPELTGTLSGDPLVLRISFDTDAQLIREEPLDGGTLFLFDPSSVLLALEVVGRGTHVFTIDDTIPPPSNLALFDDFVTGVVEFPIIDSLQFRHAYFTTAGVHEFDVLAVFSSTDTSIVNGPELTLAPDPRFSVGVERLISIGDPASNGFSGSFSSLIRLPVIIPEPGSFALLGLGLIAFVAARRFDVERAG